MPEQDFLTVTTGGQRLAFPLEAVRGVRPWELPLPLPGSSPWVEGVLPGEGEAWPVLSEAFWASGPGQATDVRKPDVFVFVSLRGRILALPGSAPAILRGSDGEGGGEMDLPVADRETGGPEATRVELTRLYSELGLDYNEA
jgi:hypothetical protein